MIAKEVEQSVIGMVRKKRRTKRKIKNWCRVSQMWHKYTPGLKWTKRVENFLIKLVSRCQFPKFSWRDFSFRLKTTEKMCEYKTWLTFPTSVKA